MISWDDFKGKVKPEVVKRAKKRVDALILVSVCVFCEEDIIVLLECERCGGCDACCPDRCGNYI